MEGYQDDQKGQPLMLRFFIGLLVLSSCSMGTIRSGGEKPYVYDPDRSYTSAELNNLSHDLVTTLSRGPKVGKFEDLFKKGQAPLKRIGIVIFETEIEPTRDGLAGRNEIYLNPAGKQIMTEDFLKIWEESVKLMSPDVDYVSTRQIKKARSFSEYGSAEDDFVQSKRTVLAPDDIFYLESSKKTTAVTTLNPRGMRDMSFLLVPAYELMGGPKWSEQNKQFLNDVSKELNLDALIVVMSQVSWTAAHTDKHSGENYPEEIHLKIKSSTLIPLHSYHTRLERAGLSDKPGVTLCYKAYESEIRFPTEISVSSDLKNFETIRKNVLVPVFKSYKDLAQMMIFSITSDLEKTW